MNNIKTWVISLRDSVERRALISGRLREVGLVAEFFDAIEGREVRRQAPHAWQEAARLSDGELGCYLSHVAIWRKVVEDNVPYALVLEDDVRLDADIAEICKELVSSPPAFDLIRLSSLEPQIGRRIRGLSHGRTLILPAKDPFGTQGYLVSAAGARRLLSTMEQPGLPIDREFNLYWRHELRALLVSPPLVGHDWDIESTIVPTGRAEIVTSLPPLARLSRSLQKKLAIYRIYKGLTGQGLLSFLRATYARN